MMRSDDIIKVRIPWYDMCIPFIDDIFPASTQTWLVGEIIYICLDGKYPLAHGGINMGGWDSCIKKWQITNKQQGSMWVQATSFVNQQRKIGFQTLRLPK